MSRVWEDQVGEVPFELKLRWRINTRDEGERMKKMNLMQTMSVEGVAVGSKHGFIMFILIVLGLTT